MWITIFIVGCWILGWLYVRRSDCRNRSAAGYQTWGSSLVKLRVLVSLWLVTLLFGTSRLLVLGDDIVTVGFLVAAVLAAAFSVERKIWQLGVNLKKAEKIDEK